MRAQLRRVDSLTGDEIVGRKGGKYSADLEYDSNGNLKVRLKY